MVIIDKGDKELLKESLVGDNPVIDNEELNNVLLNLIDMVGGKEILADIEELVKPYDEPKEALAELEELVKTLDSFGVDNYTLNLGVARGLDYYTGIVFEVYIPELGAQKQVCGGGTYSLIKVFGGEEIESTGFAFGFDRLMNAIEELNGEKELKPYLDVFVAPINDETRQKSFEITQTLRKNGIATDVDLNRKKFKKLMNHANNINVGKVVIVGKKDLDEGKVTVKDMNSGEQELVSLDSLVDYIKGEL